MDNRLKFWFGFFKLWFKNILLGIDQFLGTLVGFDPDETISSVIGKGKQRGNKWAIMLAKPLDWLDPRHTEIAMIKDGDEGSNSVWEYWKRNKKK